MKFMMIVKASKQSEAGQMPSDELISAMTKYNEELGKAGALIDLSGLQPSSKGARIKFSDGKPSVTDGPFAETKELIAGYWIIDVASKDVALEWAKKIPFGKLAGTEGAEVELRPFFEIGDFDPSPAVEEAKGVEKYLAGKK